MTLARQVSRTFQVPCPPLNYEVTWHRIIYLLMVLRRPDIWPPGDLALQKALGRLLGTGSPPTASMSIESPRWRPLRAVAARILWHSYLAERTA